MVTAYRANDDILIIGTQSEYNLYVVNFEDLDTPIVLNK